MVDGVVGMGSRELLVPETELPATILGIAFWVAVGVGGPLLLVVLVEAAEFVQKAFREGRSWTVWIWRNWFSILLLLAAAATVVRLLLDPSPFLYQGSRPSLARWQLWLFAAGSALLAVRFRVVVRSGSSARREAEPVDEKDRGVK